MSLQAVREFPRPVERQDLDRVHVDRAVERDGNLDGEIRAGREALAGYRWAEARARFEAALEGEESPEALEGLGVARFWSGEVVESFAPRERAFALYRRRGDRRDAARVAIALGLSYAAARGEDAVAGGWLRRAHRLLDGLEPGPEQAWLTLWEAHLAFLFHDDLETALNLHARALALVRELGDVDLEMMSLAIEGLTLVARGQVEDGMWRLDEAAVAAVSGEITDLEAFGQACCYMMRACEQVQDFDRAAQWVERGRDTSRRLGLPVSVSYCRNHYAAVLTWRGAWEEAEAELEALEQELAGPAPTILPEKAARLGEIRRRQGRFAEAAELFTRGEASPLAALGRAFLALDEGDPAAAVDLAHRYFRRLPAGDRISRAPALGLLVAAHCALGERERAADALAELEAVAAAAPRGAFAAAVAAAEGQMAACAGDHGAACCRFADAVYGFERAATPFETGRARLGLAAALAALGRRAGAEHEARVALAAFERIGAAHEASRAAALLAEIAASAPAAGASGAGCGACPDGLTARQREVLQLVAQGLSNKQIGGRLFLSEFTVKRHVADVLTKLDLPSRAAAAAWAVQRGLA